MSTAAISAAPAIGAAGDRTGGRRGERRPAWPVVVLAALGVVVTGVAVGYRPIAGVGAVAAVAAGLVLLRYPVSAGLLLVALVPVLSGLKRGLLLPGFRLTEVAIVGIGILILIPLEVRKAVRWRTFDWIALAYVIATAALGWFDVTRRGATLSTSDLGTLLGPLQYLVLYRAITTVVRTPAQQARALRLLILVSPIVSLLAIAQQLNLPGVRSFLFTITGADLYSLHPQSGIQPLTIPPRASGPFPFWHETGGYLMIIVLLIVGLLLSESQRTASRRLLLVVLALDTAALVQTVTIAPIIGAVVGVAALGWWYRRTKIVLACLACGALLLGALYFPMLQSRSERQFAQTPGVTTVAVSPIVPQTLAYRLWIFKTQDMPLLRGRWLTGYGPSLPSSYGFAYTESLYFTMLLRGGLILLAVFLTLMWALLIAARTAMRLAQHAEQLVVARVTVLIVVLLTLIHLIEGYFVDTGPADLIWVLAALLVRPVGRRT